MRKFLSSACVGAVLLAGGAAWAADPVEPSYDWTGFYIGLHAGYASANGDYFYDTAGATFDFNASGLRFGGLGGYNYQMDNIVWGVEGDVSFGEIDDRTGPGGAIDDFDIEPEGTIRARLGFAMDRLLPFITAGIALADADSREPGLGLDSKLHLGFVVGGGLEYAVTDDFRLRGEYLFESFGKKTYNIGPFNDTAKWDEHIVRGALIWNFGGL